jgi:putative glycosyltransferase (TIGR04372 family)
MIIKKIYRIIDFFFKISFFLYSILVLIKNIKKIRNHKNIIYQKAGGFGHTIITANYIKYLSQIERKSIILIQQFDYRRYNKSLLKSINISYIEIPRNLTLVLLNKFIILGEQEDRTNIQNAKISLYNKIFYDFLSFIKRKDTELKTESELYKEIIKKHYPNKYSQINEPKHRKKSCCFYYLTDFTEPLKLENNSRIKILNKINLMKNRLDRKKIVTIYIRHRKENNNYFNEPRNNNLKDYIKLIDFLNENKYLILLIGDTNYFDLKKIKNIFTANILSVDKDSFDIFATTEVDLFIGTEGGAQNLAVQLKSKKLSVNHFPYGHKTKDTKILYKKIIFNSQVLNESECFAKINFERFLDKNYTIQDNSPDEILNYVKKNIN